jgi:hypothetical protein
LLLLLTLVGAVISWQVVKKCTYKSRKRLSKKKKL